MRLRQKTRGLCTFRQHEARAHGRVDCPRRVPSLSSIFITLLYPGDGNAFKPLVSHMSLRVFPHGCAALQNGITELHSWRSRLASLTCQISAKLRGRMDDMIRKSANFLREQQPLGKNSSS